MRFGLGAGYSAVDVSWPQMQAVGIDSISSSGFAVVGEMAFGGTPAPGLAIGGMSFSAHVPSLSISITSKGEDYDQGSTSAVVAAVGPFVDFYPDPRAGFHVGGALGWANAVASKGKLNTQTGLTLPPDDSSGSGFAAVVSAGLEEWASDQWSIGVLVRVMYADVSMKSINASGEPLAVHFWIPQALLTFTYH